MRKQDYFRFIDSNGTCDVASQEHYLLINCAGCCVMPYHFTTHVISGRKDYYLMYLYKGEMHVFVNGETRVIQAGQVVVFKPGHEYKYTMLHNEEIIYYWVCFTGYHAAELISECDLNEKNVYDTGIHYDIISLFNDLFREFIHKNKCFQLSVMSLVISICVYFNRYINDFHKKTIAAEYKKMCASVEYINQNYNADITVRDLAETEHFSIGYYRALFKKHVGMSPYEYIVNLRIRQAVLLIIQTDMDIKTISEMVGYSDNCYFSRIFKERVGYTPSDCRRFINKEK